MYTILSIGLSLLSLQSSNLAQGVMKLAQDGLTVLLWLSPVVGSIACGYCGIRRYWADSNEVSMWNKRIIGIIGSVVFVFCVSGLIEIVTGYFK